MNYRHAFHAGNYADVVKHAVLVRILAYLCEKPAAFRVIDTHAGAGSYDLTGEEATRGGEWRHGILRLRDAGVDGAAGALLAPYLAIVASHNPGPDLTVYPGSPEIARAMLRRQDRLTACELEPNAALALAHHLRRDARAKAIAIDGWTALNAYVPPKERRGVVLIDPSFEAPNEFTRLFHALEAAHRKWPTGIYLAWYPVTQRAASDAFVRRLLRAGMARLLRAELSIGASEGAGPRDGLATCGLIIVNPPWTLERELHVLLPELARAFAGAKGSVRLDWLAREN